MTSLSLDSINLPGGWMLNERELCDLEMLLNGGFAPLKGFMNSAEYISVLNRMELPDGSVWPLPIVLPIPKSAFTEDSKNESLYGDNLKRSSTKLLKLRDEVGAIIAEMSVSDVFEPNVELEMEKSIGSKDLNHPYNKIIKTCENCYYVGGEVKQVNPIIHFDFNKYRLHASEVREQITKQKWKHVVGFQTRNPMHRSHFELTKQALKEVKEETGGDASLLLTPVVGPTQPGDIAYNVRVRCYKKILKHYSGDSVKLVLLPLAMRMAGPREAVWHAIIRRNFGCTHFIVGRDHAGPSAKTKEGKSFYGPYEAHELLKSVQDKLGIKPVFGKNMLYVGDEFGGYVQEGMVPNGAQPKTISGTEVRNMLETRTPVPQWYSFPEVSLELQKFYKPNYERGFCVYFTGLPCSGKSTLALALKASLLELDSETRKVTVLDADVIRTHLSQGLGFSRADRKLNVRRIGYVASEIVKHGGICLVANIAPYAEDREFNRKIITANGGAYVEVYVSTPLEVCEQRDIKELYKKAREGVIKQFTGISDPYEVPAAPELVVDSSNDLVDKVQQVTSLLSGFGYILTK